MRLRRIALAALSVVAMAVPAIAVTSTPAAAAGKDCASAPSKQIGSTARFGTEYTYWGWAEWRYGTSGACNGYKWVNVHVTETGVYIDDWGLYVETRSGTGLINKQWYSGVHHVGVGTWHSYAKYGYNVSLVAGCGCTSSKGSYVHFGDLAAYYD